MPGKIKDIVGNKYGKLIVLAFAKTFNKKTYWSCQCECGNIVEVISGSLTTGNTKTCGCSAKTRNLKHGDASEGPYKFLYMVWCSLKQRCTNPKNKGYVSYGGRGITLDPNWKTYLPFKEWAIGAGYQIGLEIDRIDNNSGYSSTNCRWVSRSINTRNRRANVVGTSQYVGVSFCNTKKKWISMIGMDGANIYIGEFLSEISAAKARDYYVKENKLEGYTINLP